jgi:hypothetical protein
MREKDFFNRINSFYEEWLPLSVFELPDYSDELGQIELLSELYNSFLNVDGFQAEEYFKLKYNVDLMNYFASHYRQENFFYFVMFLVHFIIENKIDLFFSKCECTGKFYGHWATAHIKENRMGKLVKERVLSHLFKGRYLEFYKNKFQYYERSENIEVDQDGLDKTEIITVQIHKRKLIDLIVNVSGASIFISSLRNIANSKFTVWKNVDDSTQFMYTMSAVPGSIQLYGFCMEKIKPSPNRSSVYSSINPQFAPNHIKEVLNRTKYFLAYFVKYTEMAEESKGILELAKKNKNKVWRHFQIMFWMMTQKFFQNEKDDSWKEFFYTIQTENRISGGLAFQLQGGLSLDKDYLTLYELSEKIILSNMHYLHPENRHLPELISMKIKEELNQEEE